MLEWHRKTAFPLEKNSFASAQGKKKEKFIGSYLFLNIQNKLGQRVTRVYVTFRTKLVIELGSDSTEQASINVL